MVTGFFTKKPSRSPFFNIIFLRTPPSVFFPKQKHLVSASSHLLFRGTVLATLVLVALFAMHYPSLISHSFRLSAATAPSSRSMHHSLLDLSSPAWEREARRSATPRRDECASVLVTGAAGFVGSHYALALRTRGDGVLGLDSFDAYYDSALKRARRRLLTSHGIAILHVDVNYHFTDRPASR
jgi:UDP-glucuronate 4-epimerase